MIISDYLFEEQELFKGIRIEREKQGYDFVTAKKIVKENLEKDPAFYDQYDFDDFEDADEDKEITNYKSAIDLENDYVEIKFDYYEPYF